MYGKIMNIDFSSIAPNTDFGKLLRLPLALVPRSAVVRILQGPLRGCYWIAGSFNHGCWLGSYEMRKQKSFAHSIEPGQIVYDIGANVGIYTLLASKCVSAKGQVFAFEPLPENIKYLEKHVKLNDCQNVMIQSAAICDHCGVMRFEDAGCRATAHLSSNGVLEVKTYSLDEFIYVLNNPIPDIIKIDVEGAEYAVLQGARKLLTTNPPIIFLATHSSEIHAACCQLLNAVHYRLESIGHQPVETTDELLCHPSN